VPRVADGCAAAAPPLNRQTLVPATITTCLEPPLTRTSTLARTACAALALSVCFAPDASQAESPPARPNAASVVPLGESALPGRMEVQGNEVLPATLGEDRPEWARTLERIATGVVAIQVDLARAFDTEWNASAQATGFVVDAKRGLLLTNRHVVTAGPVTAQAVFLDREEVPLYPVYRDPVHDFGIYRYDPARLRFIKPEAIPLAPSGALVGTEIRVVGNDAGEQLSILAGTIARIDRQAPNYGFGKYNDFNTFYYQAASSTSGGSSGSPVVDIRGRAIALNAGGANGAASSFYLPLNRVVRALKLISNGQPVPRGTLNTVFDYAPFDQLRRLGLDAKTEADVRKSVPKQVGMLVVTAVQPGSPAEGNLEVGDIVLRIDGRLVTEFNGLEEVLDDAVGRPVTVQILRGGEPREAKVVVSDLERVAPSEFIEIGEAVLNDVSWQAARHLNVPIQGVYVANPGYLFGAAAVPRGALLTAMNGVPLTSLDDLEQVLEGLGDGDRATVRFITLDDSRNTQLRPVHMDRRWFPARRCHRDDSTGLWPCRELAPGKPPVAATGASTTYARTGDVRADRLAPSLVSVAFDMPYSVSGVTERNYHGTGVVVDAQRGLVVVDRNTVPVALGDVRLTFAGTVEIPATVVYVHPLHNLAVLHYDPRLLGTTPVQSARFARREVPPGEQVWVVGLRSDQRVASQEARIGSLDAVQFPPSNTYAFRDTNLDVYTLVDGPTDFDGVIADKSGQVIALWSSFAYDKGRELQQLNLGTPAELVTELVDVVRTGTVLRSLEAEFSVVPLAAASDLGLPAVWRHRLEAHGGARRQLLGITRLVAGSPAAQVLQSGDLVLAASGEVVNQFREVERAAQRPHLQLTVWRAGAEQTVEIDTVPLSGDDVTRVVLWAGATLQAPHRALSVQRGVSPEGVFVAYFAYGSPTTRSGLWAGRRIVAVDGRPTPDLDAFLAAVAGRDDRASVRLKTITWNHSVEVITLKLDKHYWPAYELVRGPDGWERRPLG
jgi:S1-C subfamily serine protease